MARQSIKSIKESVSRNATTNRQRTIANLIAAQVREHRRDPDIVSISSLNRSIIDDKELTADDLLDAGFIKSLIAVPELGQESIWTYRHPLNGLHFHKHPNKWLFHEDKYSSLQMLLKRYALENPQAQWSDKLRYAVTDAIPNSLSHVVNEGLPGWMNIAVGALKGAPGMSQSRKDSSEAPINIGKGLLNSATAVGILSAIRYAKQRISGNSDPDIKKIVGSNATGVAGVILGDWIAKKIYKLKNNDKVSDDKTLADALILTGTPIITGLAGMSVGETLMDKLQK